ncbi:serine/threonine-protein kinase mph1 isoform X1 [Cotesia glomerata]|uniref:Protein kinase domain-containing protein n=1 Tax=Cotesia glomerata TaxID=32391 RepID=A0AAV7J1L2_COTGL|nr:serine/threonine-protein kinase mph1 isoform X1 [Cotesia glomerata]XP_044595396.1 serine/threonine-protein kinase mph1 isoform X1 [Cotesia glomerata]KAH0563829.1 hypothetical protein KQX54_007086 [Cotesia glomerata]
MSQELKNDSLSVQNSSTAGTVSHQSLSRCKSEPVRIKEFMNLCEFDGDDDDDDDDGHDDDSGEKTKTFDDDIGESELDDCQSLPPDENEYIRDPHFQYSSKDEKSPETVVNIHDSGMKKIDLAEGSHSSLINSMATVPDFIQSKISNINIPNHDRLQDYKYSNDNVDDLKLSKQLFISNSPSDLAKEDISSTASLCSNQSDNSVQKQSNILSAQVSGLSTIIKSNSNLSNSNYIMKQPSIMSEVSNVIHSTQERRVQSTSNYKIESTSALDRQPLTNQYQILSNQLATKTPLKQNPPISSSRPVPSVSHKNLFQTPQNKTNGDYVNSSHIQTPATIFSHWTQNNMMSTPLQNRMLGSGQTPGQSLSSKRDLQWQRNSDSSVKGARRPLAETSESRASVRNLPSHGKTLEINENQSREHLKTIPEKLSLVSSVSDLKENKQPPVRAELKFQSSENDSQKHFVTSRSRSAEPIPDHYNTEKKNTTGEYVSKNYPVCNSSKHTEYEIDKHRGELKNKPTTHVSDTYSTEKRHTMGDHIPNTYKVNHQSRRTDYELEKHPSESKGILTKPLSERHASNRPTVALESVAARENINKNSAVDNVKIQASVPSSTKKSQHGKTITVKNKEYMILGFLGQGMSGNVYRVQDLKTFELRAIKVVDLSRMDKENMQSSIQEINMLCKLQAPCIVQMFDYEIIGQTIYVVLEMGDTDLSKFIKTICAEKKLPVTMILYYWTEMLTAVKYIHDHGVIHSDLKPANFLLVRGRLKLIDFGIASTVHGDMTSVIKNVTVGTLNYISPEALMDVDETSHQNSKYKISYKSDVWSLGCILYSLVFGYTPFQHIRQNWAKIGAITNPSTKISFDLPPNSQPIPSILIDVIKRCLNYNPKERPSVCDLINIQYISITSNNTNISKPNIPHNTLVKIKQALDENEWRQFIEMMDNRIV